MAPAHPDWRLAAILAPFVIAGVAINLFLLGLLLPHQGFQALSPLQSLLWAIPLGIPATWAAARWVRRLIDEAEGKNPRPNPHGKEKK